MVYDRRHDVVVRPVHPADGPAIEAMHARCSPATLRSRWHGVSRRVPRAYLAEDSAQGDGLGRALLTATVAAVRAAGGTRLGADVLAGNPLPLRMIASFGTARVQHRHEEVRVTVDLAPVNQRLTTAGVSR
jgi:GNAT superfamily N-acetyltransferase